jgi:hypothetical protein
MTAAVHRPMVRRAQVTPYTTERRIVGTPTEVAATVDRVRRSGRLIAMTTPRLVREGDGRVYVNVRFLTPPAPAARRATAARRRTILRTTARIVAVAVPVAGVAVGAVYAVGLLIAGLVRLVPYVGGGLVVVLLLWAALGRAGVCPGLHCPGCSHGGH